MRKNHFKKALAFLVIAFQGRLYADEVLCLIKGWTADSKRTVYKCNASGMNTVYNIQKRFPNDVTANGCVNKDLKIEDKFYRQQVEFYGPDVFAQCTDDDVLFTASEG